jgi:hypothetical protein
VHTPRASAYWDEAAHEDRGRPPSFQGL